MTDLKTIRGMPDLYGENIEDISMVEKVCQKTFQSFNFQELRTPILENKSLFNRSVGESSEIMQKEVYEFKDRKDNLLCLRPEGTAGLVRALITNGLDNDEIKKLFYLGPMFRYERPQKGRKRQFFQAGVELIGDQSSDADIEIILIANTILEKLKIKSDLEINYLGNVENLKNYNDYLEKYLSETSDLPDYVMKNPIRALDSKDENIKNKMSKAKSITDFLNKDQSDEFFKIKSKLDEIGIKYKENVKLVRGLDYYNGLVFEFLSSDLGAQNAILGGGRYDGLIKKLGGRDLPATGFALGVDRLAEVVKASSQSKDLFIGCVDKESRTYAQTLGYKIRKENSSLIVENYLGNASVAKQLKKADSQGFKFAIIVGQDELKNKKVKLKNLKEDKPDLELKEKDLLEHFEC
ncbi:MAG: histidine--tRNA ligase [Amoebophilaceae bacterium TMED152]|nr:histidine--tRNA ligase [Gammaproteobacteria bacterium]RPH01303.1 MAG: histidine--tRNA ligase [Amoebophilaceae bacterium TMED152]|tara:strand:- start:4702 stop:5928 length:1227 start_codon:yes stop_codon:yes gene_type:complete